MIRRRLLSPSDHQLVHDKAMYAPIWELGFIPSSVLGWQSPASGSSGWTFSVPYEDVTLRGK